MNEIDRDRVQLRNWYLALLRQKALREASEVAAWTPGALIAADVQRIQSSILSRQQPLQPDLQPVLTLFNHQWIKAYLLALFFGITAALVLLIRQNELLAWPLALYLIGCIVLLTGGILSTQNSKIALSKAMKGALANLPSEATIPVDAAEIMLATLINEINRLRESQNLIADYPNEVVCTIDQSLSFIAVSPSSHEILGQHHLEMTQKAITEFILNTETSSLKTFFEEQRLNGKEFRYYAQMTGKNNRTIDTDWKIEWSNSQNAYFATISDVTAEKELERMRNEFIALISHDLRSPITSVQWTIKLIQNGTYGTLDETGLLRAADANDTIEFLLLMIADIIDVQKFESSTPDLVLENIDCRQVAVDSISAVKGMADAKSIKIMDHLEHIYCDVDSVRLRRVLINLLSNAIKFSPKESSIDFHLETSNDRAIFSIVDQGPGIASDQINKLFSRFGQGNGIPARGQGSGLGLYASKAIIEAHGGQLCFEPREPSGSKFTVQLPLSANS